MEHPTDRSVHIELDVALRGDELRGRAAVDGLPERDFTGWVGLIAALDALTGGAPWRMAVDDYEAFSAGGAEAADIGPILAQDRRLRDVGLAITVSGRLVREEQTIGVLLADLAARPRE